MNELKVFNNPEFGKVRTVEINGEPWLVGKDVALALGYSDTFGALKKHVDDEDKQNCQNDSFDTPRGMTIINESGLYALILSSKLPSAKEFKHWITSEVLPSIRKNGAYIRNQENMTPAEIVARGLIAAQKIIEEREKERLDHSTLASLHSYIFTLKFYKFCLNINATCFNQFLI